jgi:3-oxoadipate enol-lactonase
LSVRYASINAMDVSYRLEGPQDAPVVMFSNSLAADLSMWDAQVERLSTRFRVLRYDTRGHGGSSQPTGPFSIEDLAGDAVGLLGHLGIADVHFVGLSLGGMIGQVMGARHGGRLRSLVLCATASEMDPSVWKSRIEQVQRDGVASLAEGTLERWFTAPFRAGHPDVMAKVDSAIAATSTAGFVGCAGAIRDMNLVPMLGDITVPTLIVAGADDPSTPPAKAQAIHERIAGSRLAVLDHAAHLLNIEQAEAFGDLLEHFLDDQESHSLAGRKRAG